MKALRLALPFAALLAVLSVFLHAEPPPAKKPWGAKESKALSAVVDRYIRAEARDRRAILAEVRALGVPEEQIPKVMTGVFQQIMANGKKSEGKGECESILPERLFTDDQWKKEHKGRYVLSGQSKGRGPKPAALFIGLHGGGKNVADARGAAGQWGAAGGKAILACPWVLEPLTEGEWNKDNEQEWLCLLIEELKHTFLIDTNRIYVAGHSMGGYGSWGMGGHHPDLFAAVGPCASAPIVRMENGRVQYHEPGCLENFYNTWVRFFNCPDDPQVPVHGSRYADAKFKEWGYTHEYNEYQGIGHGYPPTGLGPIVDWMFTKVRNPYPKKLIWMPTRPYRPFSYWLSVAEIPGTPGERTRIDASITDNVVEVKFDKFSPKITVWLNEKLVDFKKPVVVRVNGSEKFNGMVAASFDVALESAVQRNDSNMWFTARVKLFDDPDDPANGGGDVTSPTGK
ncbi:MAG: prolyl oligopeptidase family serine peptidase [Candidatus Brocadiae bacterium]|nr:prolyl oligopeptidase family serine peptidase [Candidatus Brocadiia bacterium]